ncbi:DNA-binding response OmpR family regulator [Bradyrhizobium sp. GM24.11]
MMRVLLIEDDRMIGTAMQQALKDAAYAVDWVTDGETAIHAAENEAYGLALLDLGLPKADGLKVLRRLRTLGRRLPVIIVTARDGVDDRIDGLDLGADDYLVKPFEIRELLARMRAVLRREGGGSPPLLSNGKLSLDPATREARPFSARAHCSPRANILCCRRCLRGRARFCRAASSNGRFTAGMKRSRAMPLNI